MQLNSLAKRFARQIGGRKKLCMMPCHSFHVYGTWNSKEVGVGVGLKSSFGGGQDITGEDHFCGGGGLDPSSHNDKLLGLLLQCLPGCCVSQYF